MAQTPEQRKRTNALYYQKHHAQILARRRVQRRVVNRRCDTDEMTLEELIRTQNYEPKWGKRSGEVSFMEFDHVELWDDPVWDAVAAKL